MPLAPVKRGFHARIASQLQCQVHTPNVARRRMSGGKTLNPQASLCGGDVNRNSLCRWSDRRTALRDGPLYSFPDILRALQEARRLVVPTRAREVQRGSPVVILYAGVCALF